METTQPPRLLIPGLRSFYVWAEPVSWALIRLTVGLMILPHGIDKLSMGLEKTAQMAFVRRGMQPAEPLAVLIMVLETLGGLCVALGLFTRFWAAAIAIEMFVITYLYFPKFGWTRPGYEYVLMWGLVMLAIALRGGGPYSLDRVIGKEL